MAIVLLPGTLAAEAGGQKRFELHASTVGEALRQLPVTDLLFDESGELRRLVNVYVDGEITTLEGTGNGPIAAFVNAINELPRPDADGSFDVRVLDYAEHALSSGGDAIAAAYVECAVGDQILWGVGLDPNIVTASLKAVISAVNRA